MMALAEKPRVLVVDKDAHVRRLLEVVLADAGYEANFVGDGYAALDQARLTQPAIIVTEILVPRLDGLALCRLLKSDEATRASRVLVLSLLGAEERALQAGADAFLKKPIERFAFVRAMQDLSPPSDKEAAV